METIEYASYEKALECAGATVHAHKYFGSYQGDIWAKVTYKGKTGWIVIGYGSCSYCDSLEAFTSNLGWDVNPTKEQLGKFGEDYLDEIMDQETALKKALENAEWDCEAGQVAAFINETPPTSGKEE